MKSIPRHLVILLLLVGSLTLFLFAGSSNVISTAADSDTPPATVSSSSDWTVTPGSVAYVPQTVSPFYESIFGVRIFPGADPVGVYSINNNPYYIPTPPSGSVNGHTYFISRNNPIPGMVFYLRSLDDGTSGSYYAITDIHGYYKIDRVPFGNYSVYSCNDVGSMHEGYGDLVGSVGLTESDPDAQVDYQVMPV